MNYMFTDPETHIDFGFGVLATNFYDTANFLLENNQEKNRSGVLPNLYLYRHSIELYLKSLIVIIHKKLKLNYKEGEVPYDSKTPYILISGKNEPAKWKEITQCHFISALYNYFELLVEKHESNLQEIASSKLSRIINPQNKKIVDHIRDYDDRSTYFRYFDLNNTSKNNKEKEKVYNKKIEINDFENEIEKDKPTSFFIKIHAGSEEIVEVHKGLREVPLKKLTKDLSDFASYLNGIHAMFRIAVCEGY